MISKIQNINKFKFIHILIRTNESMKKYQLSVTMSPSPTAYIKLNIVCGFRRAFLKDSLSLLTEVWPNALHSVLYYSLILIKNYE